MHLHDFNKQTAKWHVVCHSERTCPEWNRRSEESLRLAPRTTRLASTPVAEAVKSFLIYPAYLALNPTWFRVIRDTVIPAQAGIQIFRLRIADLSAGVYPPFVWRGGFHPKPNVV
jgi:hypothetical protein